MFPRKKKLQTLKHFQITNTDNLIYKIYYIVSTILY